MPKPNHVQKAISLTLLWCEAVGIKGRAVDAADTDIVIEGAGKDIAISFTGAGDGRIYIDPNSLTRDPVQGLRAFHAITEATGHGSPDPLQRGLAPGRGDGDSILTALRHREFRRTPNIALQQVQSRFSDICREEVARYWWRQQRLCLRQGLEKDDLATYCSCWAMNFCCLYQKRDLPEADNRRLLRSYLRQRFRELQLQLEHRRQMPSAEDAAIASTGTVPDANFRAGAEGGRTPLQPAEAAVTVTADDGDGLSWDPEQEQWQQRPEDLRALGRRRQQRAREQLQTQLESLDHDTRIAILTEAAANAALDEDARKEARILLQHHQQDGNCRPCYGLWRAQSFTAHFHSRKVEITPQVQVQLQLMARAKVRTFYERGGKICPHCHVLKTDPNDFNLYYDFTDFSGTLEPARMKMMSWCSSCRNPSRKQDRPSA